MEQRKGCWHVLVPPRFNCRASHALARPVVDHGEWEGWRWRMEIGGQRLQLARRLEVSDPGDVVRDSARG